MYDNQNFRADSTMISGFFFFSRLFFFLILLNVKPDATTQFKPRNSLVNQNETL